LDGTVALVEAFQRSRGFQLPAQLSHNECLIEAAWRSGSAALPDPSQLARWTTSPELQVAAGTVRFNPGRIDGIFGVLTESPERIPEELRARSGGT